MNISNYTINIPTLKRLAKINVKELLFHSTYEFKRNVHKVLSSSDIILPTNIYFEPGSYCPNRCQDCYVPIKDRKDNIQLSDHAISQITHFADKSKVQYMAVMGGDPFHDIIFDKTYALLAKNSSLKFVVCNDGFSLIQGNKLHKIQKLSNTSPIFSIDGLESTNDRIRGKGSFQNTIEALKIYNEQGKYFSGIITTIRPSNIDEVISPDFINTIADTGANYIGYSNVYTEKEGGYILSSEKYADKLIELMKISKDIPMMIANSRFGQINPYTMNLKKEIYTVSIDYHGNVFSSRRGKSLGNLNDQNITLESIIRENKMNEHIAIHSHCEDTLTTDKRYGGFLDEVMDILQTKGIHVERPR